MAIGRPTLSSDVALLGEDFVHGYCEGVAVFYMSITNEGGLVDKKTNDDLESWGPLWCTVYNCFEEYLSYVPALKLLKDVKFSVCDGNHQRQAWWKQDSHADKRGCKRWPLGRLWL
jgi:hypothetical protein